MAAAYFVLLATATHWPSLQQMPFETSDKLYHFGGYAGLAFLVLCGWELTLGRLAPKHFFAVWLAGTCYGIVDELLQKPVGRSCDANDWLADELGVLCGMGFYLLVRRLWVGRESGEATTEEQSPGGAGG